jgi:hypothetical protein
MESVFWPEITIMCEVLVAMKASLTALGIPDSTPNVVPGDEIRPHLRQGSLVTDGTERQNHQQQPKRGREPVPWQPAQEGLWDQASPSQP